MLFNEENARIVARKWHQPTSTISRWRRAGIIPDLRVLSQPLDKQGRAVEQKLLLLVESGWLKARPVSRLLGPSDKVNALVLARRYPDDPRYHTHHLNGDDVKAVQRLLDGLQRSVGFVLYMASLEHEGRPYSDVVQADLRSLLHRNELATANVRAGMDKRQVARFWAFMRGGGGRRDDLDVILIRLKVLAVVLQ